jgi:hypothetical protein
MMVQSAATPVSNFTFTNNLSTHSKYGLFGANVGEGASALKTHFKDWVFAKNVLVGAAAAIYPAENFFPASVAEVQFVNYANADFNLAAHSPYKYAATDGTAIGANMSAVPAASMVSPNPPSNVVVK